MSINGHKLTAYSPHANESTFKQRNCPAWKLHLSHWSSQNVWLLSKFWLLWNLTKFPPQFFWHSSCSWWFYWLLLTSLDHPGRPKLTCASHVQLPRQQGQINSASSSSFLHSTQKMLITTSAPLDRTINNFLDTADPDAPQQLRHLQVLYIWTLNSDLVLSCEPFC